MLLVLVLTVVDRLFVRPTLWRVNFSNEVSQTHKKHNSDNPIFITYLVSALNTCAFSCLQSRPEIQFDQCHFNDGKFVIPSAALRIFRDDYQVLLVNNRESTQRSLNCLKLLHCGLNIFARTSG